MKPVCENNLSFLLKDKNDFIMFDKKTGKESFRQRIKDNPNYALSLVAKWGYRLSDGIKENELL